MKIYGWALYCKKDQKWYGSKRINGRNYNIYIGKNLDNAKSKIEAWYIKKGFMLPEGIEKNIQPNANSESKTNEAYRLSQLQSVDIKRLYKLVEEIRQHRPFRKIEEFFETVMGELGPFYPGKELQKSMELTFKNGKTKVIQKFLLGKYGFLLNKEEKEILYDDVRSIKLLN